MTPHHLHLMRVLLGIYLAVHFMHLIPYGAELFSDKGIFPDVRELPTYGMLPNPLFWLDTPRAITLVLVFLTLCSGALVWGRYVRVLSLILWVGWAALLSRSPFIANPSIPFIGLLLLCFAALPKEPRPEVTRYLWTGVWVIMALSYSISGFHKLGSPSWVDGSALSILTANPLARDYVVTDTLAQLPHWLSRAMTWGALALEILFAPLAFLPRLRPWIWAAMGAMHLGILTLVSFADLTLGMLLLHLFTLDERWIPGSPPARSSASRRPLVFFDGDCMMCNRLARSLLALDSKGRLDLAPLGGVTFQERIPESIRASLPDSIILSEADGTVYTHLDAVRRIGSHVGGIPRIVSILCGLIPRQAQKAIYGWVARMRYRIYGRTVTSCGLLSASERSRILP
jgi:predicted DCC family thiol-disulfide oxidoreductase YuxK